MKCGKCGKEMDNGALFCPFCGAKASDAAPGSDAPLFRAEVKTLLKTGTLLVYRDRTEFVASSVEKKVFPYASLMAVKKGRDHIDFVLEDGRTESCPVKGESLNKAFYTLEQAVQPYLQQSRTTDDPRGIRFRLHIVPPKLNSLVSGLLSGKSEGGILYIMDQAAEYRHSTGTSETISYQDVKGAEVSGKTVKFRSYRETYRVFTSDEDIPSEVSAFLSAAIAPYVEAHREALRSQGIYFQFCRENSQVSVLRDRFISATAGEESVLSFRDVRAVSVLADQLEVHRTDATTWVCPIDSEERAALRSFLDEALAPFIALRTEGFDHAFGLEDKIEFNESRQVFHLIRQDGKEITREYPMGALTAAQACEVAMDGITKAVIGNIASGLNGQQNQEERLREIGVTFTVREEGAVGSEELCLGSFPLGLTRSNPKYGKITEELSSLLGYLEEHCPGCQVSRPQPPAEQPAGAAEPAPAAAVARESETEGAPSAERGLQKGQFGTVIDGLTGYIASCDTPMSIAVQGDWDSGSNSFLHLIYEGVGEEQNAVWLNTWQFVQAGKDQMPALLADKLIALLGGVNAEEVKDKATKVIKGIISITPVGDKALEAVDIFKTKNSAVSFENQVKQLSGLVSAKGGRAVFFVDDLNRFPPVKLIEMLDALSFFLKCSGCIFVASVEQSAVLQGKRELEGQKYSEEQARKYFSDLFKMPFHVPASSLDLHQYLTDNLGRMGICTDEETLERYARLAVLSVGAEPKALDRLMNSMRLLKSMSAGVHGYDGDLDLMLFALLCMQTSFQPAYSYLVSRKSQISPEFLNGLSSRQSADLEQMGLAGEQQAKFCDFAGELCRAISVDGVAGVSEEECRTFVKALNISAVTAK